MDCPWFTVSSRNHPISKMKKLLNWEEKKRLTNNSYCLTNKKLLISRSEICPVPWHSISFSSAVRDLLAMLMPSHFFGGTAHCARTVESARPKKHLVTQKTATTTEKQKEKTEEKNKLTLRGFQYELGQNKRQFIQMLQRLLGKSQALISCGQWLLCLKKTNPYGLIRQ